MIFIYGCRISRGAPSISHLLFIDDSFLFFNDTEQECYKMQNTLETYERISVQAVNLQKSGIFFSNNVHESLRLHISNRLAIFAPLNTRRYLGLPFLIDRNKRVIFAFLQERMWNRLQGWPAKLLSHTEKEVLIKTFAKAIPTFCMSYFLISVSLCQEFEIMMNSFW